MQCRSSRISWSLTAQTHVICLKPYLVNCPYHFISFSGSRGFFVYNRSPSPSLICFLTCPYIFTNSTTNHHKHERSKSKIHFLESYLLSTTPKNPTEMSHLRIIRSEIDEQRARRDELFAEIRELEWETGVKPENVLLPSLPPFSVFSRHALHLVAVRVLTSIGAASSLGL